MHVFGRWLHRGLLLDMSATRVPRVALDWSSSEQTAPHLGQYLAPIWTTLVCTHTRIRHSLRPSLYSEASKGTSSCWLEAFEHGYTFVTCSYQWDLFFWLFFFDFFLGVVLKKPKKCYNKGWMYIKNKVARVATRMHTMMDGWMVSPYSPGARHQHCVQIVLFYIDVARTPPRRGEKHHVSLHKHGGKTETPCWL